MTKPLASPAAARPAPSRVLRRLLATGTLAISIAVSGMAATATPAQAHGGDGLREAANEERSGKGLAPVFGTQLLDDIAIHRAAQLVAADELEHDIDYVFDRLNATHTCWKGVGEIIAWERGYPDYDPRRVMQAWMDSPTHHAIVMGDAYNAAGGAWKTADDGAHYSVMVFAVLCDAPATAESLVKPLRPSETYSADRPLVVAAGTHTAFRFGADGQVLARRTQRYAHKTTLTGGGRAYVGGKAYLKVSSGALRGYWVRESTSSFIRGMTYKRTFEAPRDVMVDKGRYAGHSFSAQGYVVDTVQRRFWHRRQQGAISRAVINGRWFLKFDTGKLAGHWVRELSSVDLR